MIIFFENDITLNFVTQAAIMLCMPTLSVRFGDVIRTHRKRRNLSQENLAALANLSRAYVGLIERGAVQPSIEIIDKLAQALGERVSDLMREAEENG